MNERLSLIIKDWLPGPRVAANRLVEYYGEPDEVSQNRFTWYRTKDGWKRTVLVNQEIPHNFPVPHTDFLEQSINYQVPTDKFDEIGEFDGSIIVERTKGELSARCGGRSMNFVAINLAHDIITNAKSVKEAREEYTKLYADYKSGKKHPYAEVFQFDVSVYNTKDPDETTLR